MADIIDVAPRAGLLGLTDPRIVKPGDPANSVLFHRDASGTPSVMMPPLAIRHDAATRQIPSRLPLH